MSKNLANNHKLIEVLRAGGIAVIRTDTLYGLVACADNEVAVERVYTVKGRDAHKSCIVLLDDMNRAYGRQEDLGTDDQMYQGEVPTSFLIDGTGAPSWLLRENSELAYRVPHSDDLRAFLTQTGPLIAPSANPQGEPPARTIEEAKAYFGDKVDIYVDEGEVPASTPPSRLIRIHDDGSVERLR